MENPWAHLPETEPYILREDLPNISLFNQKSGTDHRIVTDILPEPFLGNITDAKVVLLNLNPGFSEKDLFWHTQPEFISENKKNLLHESNPPFYLLNSNFHDSEGFVWWRAHLKQFISLVGLEKVARSFLCIEYFPYHSKRYKSMPIIPSQAYSFYLVTNAMKRKLPIIIMRGKRLWIESVPELSTYPYNTLRFPRNACLTKNNLPQGIFDSIATILSS